MRNLSIKYGKHNVPYLKKEDIEHDAEKLIKDFCPDIFDNPHPVDIESFIEIYLGVELIFTHLSHNDTYLGRTIFNDNTHVYTYNSETGRAQDSFFNDNTIIIEANLADDYSMEHRFRYTCGHECGHYLYHRRYYEIDKNQLNLFDMIEDKHSFSLDLHSLFEKNNDYHKKSDIDWLEWQADYMSAALLMPRKSVFKLLEKHKNRSWIEKSLIVSNTFNVSLTAAEIRLKNLGIV